MLQYSTLSAGTLSHSLNKFKTVVPKHSTFSELRTLPDYAVCTAVYKNGNERLKLFQCKTDQWSSRTKMVMSDQPESEDDLVIGPD